EAMNAIWHCHQRRPLFRRLMDYLALFILLPLSLNIAVAAEAILASDQLMAQLHLFLPSSWALTFFVKLTTFAFIVLSLMAMYMFFPSDKVQTSAALAGALFAAFFWFLFQRLYIVLQIGVSKYNAIYGSFATVPLVLVSLNLGIVFILLGASLTHAIQYRNHYGFIARELAPQRQLQMAFDVLTIVYHNFSQRIPTTIELLQKSLPVVRPLHIEEIVDLLVSGNLLQQNADDTDMVIPVTSAEQLSGSEVVELVLGNDSLDTPGGILAQKALRAAADSLHGNLLTAMRQAMGHHQDG
ncbi:MAG: YihY/virulence factor BrkB family protein, partial [Desulfobulbaceae bacterium]|nr:YihY/virulence factor BrkB family protein [Desulfobulbaceae bacterium]